MIFFIKPISYKSQIFSLSTQRCVLFCNTIFKEVRNIKAKLTKNLSKNSNQKTTDDCYTPPEIYEVIKEWVCKRYNIDPGNVIRPFWPGSDYEKTSTRRDVWWWTTRLFPS